MLAATLTAALAALLPAPVPPGGAPPMARDGPTGRVTLATGWHYAADPSGTGASEGWASGSFDGPPITVPHAANPQSLGRPAAAVAFRGSQGWYRRDLRVAGGTYALEFSSAAFQADVFLDGRFAGTHRGAYAPFTVRVRLRPGIHRLVVHVDWRSPQRQSAAGFHRTWFNYGGLNREVTVRRVRPSEVEGVTVRTHLRRDGAARVSIAARVVNHGPQRRLGVLGRLGRVRFFSLPGTDDRRGRERHAEHDDHRRAPAPVVPGPRRAVRPGARRPARGRLRRAGRPARAALERRRPARQRAPHGAPRRVGAGGRARPRRRADGGRHGPDRRPPARRRRERHPCPAPARTGARRAPGRRGHRALAGDRPRRLAGRVPHGEPCAAGARAAARPGRLRREPPASRHPRLEPRLRGRRQRDGAAGSLDRRRGTGAARRRRRPPHRGGRLERPPAGGPRPPVRPPRRRRHDELPGLV